MLQKTTRMNFLFDFYESLLTKRQQLYLSYYYRQDYTLSEIAQYVNVSRQAVYDNIKRTEETLELYEEKLKLYDKFMKRKEIIDELKALNKDIKITKHLERLEQLN